MQAHTWVRSTIIRGILQEIYQNEQSLRLLWAESTSCSFLICYSVSITRICKARLFIWFSNFLKRSSHFQLQINANKEWSSFSALRVTNIVLGTSCFLSSEHLEYMLFRLQYKHILMVRGKSRSPGIVHFMILIRWW